MKFAYSNAAFDAPTEFNTAEDLPQADLVRVLNEFADGSGSNIITLTHGLGWCTSTDCGSRNGPVATVFWMPMKMISCRSCYWYCRVSLSRLGTNPSS